MNGARTIFRRKGYLLTALAAAVAACGVFWDGAGAEPWTCAERHRNQAHRAANGGPRARTRQSPCAPRPWSHLR